MFRSSRREFLEQSMFATAALCLANTTKAIADDDVVPAGDEKFRVAVVGVKGRGGSHIAEFGARPDCEIAALVDVDETMLNAKANEIESRTGKRPALYSDLRKCFEDKSIHIASIATPNHWHALAAIWAADDIRLLSWRR